MKRPLILKLSICYLLLALSMFVIINTVGVRQLKRNLLEEKKTILYNEACLLASEYVTNYYNGKMTLGNLSMQLDILDTFLDARIWIVNREGLLISDTGQKQMVGNVNINDLDPDFLSQTFSQKTVIPPLILEPMLSIILPVSVGFEVRGYIVIHTSLDIIQKESIYYMDIMNLCFLIFLVLLLVFFSYIVSTSVLPLKRMILATKEYADGHFDYPLQISSSDEYRELSNAIQYMASELNSLDDYQKKFVANISHDFRSPLTSIKGYAEAILDGTIPVELQGKYLDIIVFETERLTKLTTNLLALNSFENKGAMLDITSFDINKIITRTAESFEQICTKKKIVLTLYFSDETTFVSADMSKIQQVLYNLIDNAIKFSSYDSIIKLSTTEKNDKVFISVKDNGIGIPKESIKKIWERFYKTDVSRGKDKKGTGLGLSITREIINAHKENIDVISTEEVGTEFIFTLPKAEY